MGEGGVKKILGESHMANPIPHLEKVCNSEKSSRLDIQNGMFVSV